MLISKKIFIRLSTLGICLFICPCVKAAIIDREINDIHKQWNIKFNQEIKFNKNVENEITVKDQKGNILKTEIKIKDNNKTLVVCCPEDDYKLDEIYTLNVGNKIYAKNSSQLKNKKIITFKVNKKDDIKITKEYKYKDIINNTINTTAKCVEKLGVKTAWEAIGLKEANKKVPISYIKNVENELRKNKGKLEQTTDYERETLGLLAADKDPLNIGGFNLINKICNDEDLDSQGINAEIFGLIALDAKSYNVPDKAIWTREKLIKAILENRTNDGGWDFAGVKADPDMTGMALIALAPYTDKPEVKKAIDIAIDKLSKIQKPSGAFSSYNVENCESICQVIIGLCANNVDPLDNRFVKNGKNMIETLMKFKTTDGRFSHKVNGKADDKPTEQALQALEAYRNLKEKGQGKIYKF